MWEWIARLQGMSETARRRVAFFIAGALTALIIIVWFFVGFISGLPSHTYQDGASTEGPVSSFREDAARAREVGGQQIQAWRRAWETFKSMPQGTSTDQ